MNESVRGQTVGILYGKSEMELRLPQNAHATVIAKRPMAKLPDPRAVRDALARRSAPLRMKRWSAGAGARAS